MQILQQQGHPCHPCPLDTFLVYSIFEKKGRQTVITPVDPSVNLSWSTHLSVSVFYKYKGHLHGIIAPQCINKMLSNNTYLETRIQPQHDDLC